MVLRLCEKFGIPSFEQFRRMLTPKEFFTWIAYYDLEQDEQETDGMKDADEWAATFEREFIGQRSLG